MSSIKIKRINAQLVRVISEVLYQANNPFLKNITITGCDTSQDLSYAKVYFTSLENLDKEYLEQEIAKSADFIRKEVALKIDIRTMPKLKFIFDESIEYGNQIEQKLAEIHQKENKQ